MRFLSSIRVAFLLALLGQAAYAQSGKKVLTQDTYDFWRTIQGASLSPDGKWAGYTQTPVVGDGEVIIRATASATEFRFPRGWMGRPITSVAASDSPFVSPPVQFTADSRRVLFLRYAPKADFDRARREKRPASQLPRASLGIVDLADGSLTNVPRVRSFRVPRGSGRYAVYLLEGPDTARDSTSTPRPVSGETPRPAGKRREYGSVLVIRDLQSGAEQTVNDVLSYAVDDSARWVAYAVSSRNASSDGAYLRALATGQTATLLDGEGDYKQLAFDRAGTAVAFVSNRSEFRNDKPRFTLYYAATKSPAIVTAAAPEAVDGLSPSDKGRVEFTRDGNAVLFGVAPPARDSIPADSLADRAVFDLWHWKDTRLQPQQRLEAARDRDRTYAAVYVPKSRRVLRLANDSMPSATVSDDGRVALVVTPVPYMLEAMWGDGGSDVFIVDLSSGVTTRVAAHVEFGAQLSPGGKYVVWFTKGQWHSYIVATGARVELSAKAPDVRFDDVEWDSPDTAPPYGVAGWTRDDRDVLLYDQYDVWNFDPAGVRAPRNITDAVGRREHVRLRLVDLDPDDRFIDPAQPLLLRAFNVDTKASGFYRDRLEASVPPERLVMADRAFGMPQKARHADQLLLTEQTVSEFPDLYVGPSLTSLTKISNANPQQSEYRWPSVELVKWSSSDGVALQGLLYKPEGFDPTQKYPMIVYYYERLSDGLHSYNAPTGRNVINPTVYTSLGYLVFFPDIVYEIGWPGPSAVKSIIPGVQSLVQRGFVNPKAIGLAGQSWGGYQTAYLITQTGMFAAAVPNAPVANMTSAYGGIRWGSGLARAFQYERTQSRIGGSIWQYPVRYIENSPLFHLDRVTTPVFFMQNDADDAVPWYQGIELFVGLRRLGKEVYFITYNGDVHNPRKRANQKDIDMRMQQFFATKLLGAPAPDWMVHGIPFLEKGRDQIAQDKPASPAAQMPQKP